MGLPSRCVVIKTYGTAVASIDTTKFSGLSPKPLLLPSNLKIIVTALDGLKRVTTRPMVIFRGNHVERVVTD